MSVPPRQRVGPIARVASAIASSPGVCCDSSGWQAKQYEAEHAPSTRDTAEKVRVSIDVSPHAGKYALAVMVKAPRVGEVKTRLVPPLSAEPASLLRRGFFH